VCFGELGHRVHVPEGSVRRTSSMSAPSFFAIFLAQSDGLSLPCLMAMAFSQCFLTAASGPHMIFPSVSFPTAASSAPG